jgi:hypothetical protein
VDTQADLGIVIAGGPFYLCLTHFLISLRPSLFHHQATRCCSNMVGLLYRLRTFLESSAFIRGCQNHR